CAIVDPVGLSGGLVLCWNNEVQISQVICQQFFIAVEYKMADVASTWGTFVYLSTSNTIRQDQWRDLETAKSLWGDNLYIQGNWNDINSKEDKRGRIPRSESSKAGFRNFTNLMGMEEIRMIGNKFTWCNNRFTEGLVEEKLDRGFASPDWLENHPHAYISTMTKASSDHSMLILHIWDSKSKRKSKFSFDKRWLTRKGVGDIMKAAWNLPQSGTPFFILKEKIKTTRLALLKWSASFKTENQSLIANLSKKLDLLQENRNTTNWENWISSEIELEAAHRSEEIFWLQKANVQWLREGDCNSKFFHSYTMQRRRQNAITRIVTSQNRVCNTHKDIQDHITDFYSELFTSEGSWGGDSILQLIPHSVTSDMNLQLLKTVDEEEIKATLFSLHPEKTPGEDGMTALFYQSFWKIIKPEL
ncbi:Unknown protein, partial [Striga hermonthica]